jgi:hypothetical protein
MFENPELCAMDRPGKLRRLNQPKHNHLTILSLLISQKFGKGRYLLQIIKAIGQFRLIAWERVGLFLIILKNQDIPREKSEKS